MISNRKLNMVFTRGNTTKTISLANPRQDVTGPEVHGCYEGYYRQGGFLL